MGHDGVELLGSAAILFGTAIAVALLFRAARLPTVVGFIFAGVVIGPHVLGAIERDKIERLAEVGLVLLMFMVGLELSPKNFLRTGLRAAGVGLVHFGVTAAVIGLLAWGVHGLAAGAAIVIGVAVVNSSTAIAMKVLSDRGETDSVAGNVLVTTSLVQDVLMVAFMLGMPLLAGRAADAEATADLLKSTGLFVACAGAAWLVLPRAATIVSARGGRELLALLAVVSACAGAWAAGRMGWSLALGAFLAGVFLAESESREVLASEILPFRDVFNALFFMSMGMLLNVPLVIAQLPLLGGMVVITMLLKAGVGWAAVSAFGWPLRVAVVVGIGLSPLSELAMVLAAESRRLRLLDDGTVDLLIAVAVASMLLGALWFFAAPRLASLLATAAARTGTRRAAPARGEADEAGLNGHVIIVGYGLNGHNLSQVLRATRIPHCVVEMNPSLAAQATADGCPMVIRADASRSWILDRARVSAARALVVGVNDREATRRIVAQAARMHPGLYILARTRFVSEIDALYRLGARMVIPEEFETSIEIFAHVLKEYGVADNVVEAQIEMIRAGRYRMLRGLPAVATMPTDVIRLLEATTTQTHMLEAGSPAADRSIRELDLRSATGVTIIAVVREGRATTSPPPDMALRVGDVLVLVGPHAGLDKARAALSAPPATTAEDAQDVTA